MGPPGGGGRYPGFPAAIPWAPGEPPGSISGLKLPTGKTNISQMGGRAIHRPSVRLQPRIRNDRCDFSAAYFPTSVLPQDPIPRGFAQIPVSAATR